jgi:hypothetical protein
MSEENQVESTGTNLITFADGSVRDFGKKGQIQKEVVITEDKIAITFFLVTGIVHELAFAKSNPLYDTMAARGIIEFVGNSIAGVYQDKDGTHPEDFNLGIEQAISALESGIIPTREKADKAAKGLGDLIKAYVELRAADGRFSAEESSYEFIKELILSSDEATNKARMAQASVRAKIEQYKAERQAAKAAKAAAGAAEVIADLI